MTDLGKLRILVIDDETTQRMLVKEYLEDAGHVVRQAEDGRRGLKMAEVTKPDVILLDVLLPALDGYSVCRKFKETPETADTPVILFTASRETDVIERGLEAGADDFVTKPVDWNFLADRVVNVVRKARQRAELSRQVQDQAKVAARHSAALDAELREAAILEVSKDADVRLARVKDAFVAERDMLMARHADAMRDALANAAATRDAEIESMRARHEHDLNAVRDSMAQQIDAARQSAHLDAAIAERKLASELQAMQETAAAAAFDADARLEAAEAAANSRAGEAAAAWSMMLRSALAQSELASAIVTSSDAADIERNARAIAAVAAKLRIVAEALLKPAAAARPVPLAALVAEVAAQAQDAARSRRIEFACRINARDLAVPVEAEKLRYALLSLVGNALRFTPANGSVTLSLSQARDGGACMEVADTGLGIAPGKLEDLRTCLDAARRSDDGDRGYGLGVPAAAALARQMGGRLELDSSVGAGTRAALFLPPPSAVLAQPARLAG